MYFGVSAGGQHQLGGFVFGQIVQMDYHRFRLYLFYRSRCVLVFFQHCLSERFEKLHFDVRKFTIARGGSAVPHYPDLRVMLNKLRELPEIFQADLSAVDEMNKLVLEFREKFFAKSDK